jgi:hypothetical protein
MDLSVMGFEVDKNLSRSKPTLELIATITSSKEGSSAARTMGFGGEAEIVIDMELKNGSSQIATAEAKGNSLRTNQASINGIPVNGLGDNLPLRAADAAAGHIAENWHFCQLSAVGIF